MIRATKFCDGTGARAPGLRVPGARAVEIEIQVPRYLVELIGDALYLSKRIRRRTAELGSRRSFRWPSIQSHARLDGLVPTTKAVQGVQLASMARFRQPDEMWWYVAAKALYRWPYCLIVRDLFSKRMSVGFEINRDFPYQVALSFDEEAMDVLDWLESCQFQWDMYVDLPENTVRYCFRTLDDASAFKRRFGNAPQGRALASGH